MDVEVRRRVARTDAFSWGSIWAGALTAFALFVLLSVVALAAGLELAPVGTTAEPRFGTAISSIITGLFVVLAFFAGGFMASWTADLDDPEAAIAHGFVVWAVFVVLLLVVVAFGGGVGSIGNVFNPEFGGTGEEFEAVAWGAVFSFVLAVAASILGALAATRDEVRSRWSLYR